MDKPILPPCPTKEQVALWERQMKDYIDSVITYNQSLLGHYMSECKAMGHTIDRLGRRIIFRAENSKGHVRYFNQSSHAVKMTRESQNQPVKLTVMPILPAYSYWACPIKDLVRLIEEHENGK